MTTPIAAFDVIMPRSYVGTLTDIHSERYRSVPLVGEDGTSEAVSVPRGVLTISWNFPEARSMTIFTRLGGKTMEVRMLDEAQPRGVVKIPVPDSGTTLSVQTNTNDSVGIGKSFSIEVLPMPLGTIK